MTAMFVPVQLSLIQGIQLSSGNLLLEILIQDKLFDKNS